MTELTNYIEQSTGYKQPIISSVLDSLTNFIELSLRQGEEVRIDNLGIFYFKDTEERTARNPRNGESITVPPKRYPRFRFYGSLTKKIETNYQPQTTTSVNEPKPDEEGYGDLVPPPMPSEMMSVTFFMGNPDGSTTKITDEQMKKLQPTTPVWSQQTGWKQAKEIPQLAHLFMF